MEHPTPSPSAADVADLRPPVRHSLPATLCCALMVTACAAATSQAQTAPATGAIPHEVVQTYQLAPGALDAALSEFAARAGVSITIAPGLVQGKTSPGLQGRHGLRDGFARLLSGTGLEAVAGSGGIYTLRVLPVVVPGAAAGEGGTLGEVRVTAQKERPGTTEGTGSYTATGPSTTATRLALTQRETPQSVSVVTRAQMDDRGFQSLEEVALDATGLSTRKLGGGERTQFYMRGFAVNSFLADGVPIDFDSDTQGTASMAMYDRIEILRGSAGLMTGTGNPSGTINLLRKRPTDVPQVSLSGSLGSWRNRRGELDAAGPLNEAGSLRGRAVVAQQDTNTFKKAYRHERQLVYGTLEADIAPRTLLSVGGYFNKEDNPGADWNGLPTRRDGSFYPFDRSTRMTPDWAYWNKRNASVFAELEHEFDNGWRSQLTARVLKSKMDMLGTYLYPLEDSDLFGQGAGAYTYNRTQYSLDAFAKGPLQAFGRKHELVFGASLRQNSDDDGPGGWPSDYAPVVDPMNWDSSAVPRPAFSSAWSRRGHQRQLGAYSTMRLSLADSLSAIIGARVDSYRYDMHTVSGEWSEKSLYRVSDRVTPYFGLVYELDSMHSLYGSWAGVFQPQNYQAASGAMLDPVVGRNLEAGIKGSYMGGRLQASAAVFQINQSNLPLQLPGNECRTQAVVCYAQTGGVRSRGLELEMVGAITPSWKIMTGYTFNRAKHVKDSDVAKAGTPYDQQTPRHIFKLTTSYQLPGAMSKWGIGGSLRTRSETSSWHNVRQGGYTIVDLMLSYQVSPQLDIRLNINNVADRYYYEATGSTQDNNHFGAPRNFLLTANYRF